MHMLKAIAATTTLLAAACMPPPEVPPRNPGLNSSHPSGNVDPNAPDSTYSDPAPPQDPVPTRPGEYPTARPTANPNQVISPYEPYNVIDVEGFRPGQLARDPSNNRIFRVP